MALTIDPNLTYALALERILGLPVREGVLFFLRAGRESRVAL